MSNNQQAVILIILDGLGVSPVEEGNPIFEANIPFIKKLLASFPKTLLSASAESVGLSPGEMGNSEVGHLNLGTGRVVIQDLPRIDKAIFDNSFFNNETLLSACNFVRKNNSNLHFLGLVSVGGVHSHYNHLLALIDLAQRQKIKNLYIHMITDGRDSPPKVALDFVKKVNQRLTEKGFGKIATILGRYYAMDKDQRWERTEKAYQVLINGKGEKAESLEKAIENAYKRGETDEFIKPTLVNSKTQKLVNSKDALIFFNFRADRARQLTDALVSPNFKEFKRTKFLKNLFFISFTNYGFEPTPLVKIAFFAEKKIENRLSVVLAKNNLSQLHITETEKYPHVTYFFNGGEEIPEKKEERILIPSPKVATYDLKPEMSVFQISAKLIKYLRDKNPEFTIVNFANPDMVGHTGNYKATKMALEAVDKALEKVINIVLGKKMVALLCSDHGNAEQMINPATEEIDKEHTTNPVFLILIDNKRKKGENSITFEELINFFSERPIGVLADVAPTILEILKIEKPKEMKGMSLLNQVS